MNKFLNWLVVSSANPSQVSATVTGALTAAGGAILSNLSSIGITISASQYVNDVAIAAYVVGALVGGFGLIRKIVNTVQGTSAQLTPGSTPLLQLNAANPQ